MNPNPCNEVILSRNGAYAPRIEPGHYRCGSSIAVGGRSIIRIIGYCRADPRFIWVEVKGVKQRVETCKYLHIPSLEPLSPLEQLGAEGE